MNTVSINVKVKDEQKVETLVLYQKIYSTPYGIVNRWSTGDRSNYRLEIIIDEDDLSVNPAKITKSMNIITDDWNIADQMMIKLYENKSFQFQDQKMNFK